MNMKRSDNPQNSWYKKEADHFINDATSFVKWLKIFSNYYPTKGDR